MFTGDRSGDWLYGALHRAGLANQPTSSDRDDGLRLDGAYVVAAVRCAPPGNQPTPEERDALPAVPGARAGRVGARSGVVALGGFAYAAWRRSSGSGPAPASATAPKPPLPDGRTIICSFHPSQQNTFTGKLTEPMLDAVVRRAIACRPAPVRQRRSRAARSGARRSAGVA